MLQRWPPALLQSRPIQPTSLLPRVASLLPAQCVRAASIQGRAVLVSFNDWCNAANGMMHAVRYVPYGLCAAIYRAIAECSDWQLAWKQQPTCVRYGQHDLRAAVDHKLTEGLAIKRMHLQNTHHAGEHLHL
jgi:hypothetical protein